LDLGKEKRQTKVKVQKKTSNNIEGKKMGGKGENEI